MPIFFKHNLLFIHIPKCGGDTITAALASHGDPPFMFVADGAVMVNGHTPQHMTWSEYLKAGWSTPDGFRVAALVRHPVDRVTSAFRYIHRYRPDLRHLAQTPKVFLDSFFSENPDIKRRFDHHNLGLLDFITGLDGRIESSIHIRPLADMKQWLKDLGLPIIDENQIRNATGDMTHLPPFDHGDLRRIRAHFKDDIEWYEQAFPSGA